MDIIITLCGNAESSCPMTPPEIKRIHWPIDDPAGAIGIETQLVVANMVLPREVCTNDFFRRLLNRSR